MIRNPLYSPCHESFWYHARPKIEQSLLYPGLLAIHKPVHKHALQSRTTSKPHQKAMKVVSNDTIENAHGKFQKARAEFMPAFSVWGSECIEHVPQAMICCHTLSSDRRQTKFNSSKVSIWLTCLWQSITSTFFEFLSWKAMNSRLHSDYKTAIILFHHPIAILDLKSRPKTTNYKYICVHILLLSPDYNARLTHMST